MSYKHDCEFLIQGIFSPTAYKNINASFLLFYIEMFSPSMSSSCCTVTFVISIAYVSDAQNTHGLCINIMYVEASLLIFDEFLISPSQTSI